MGPPRSLSRTRTPAPATTAAPAQQREPGGRLSPHLLLSVLASGIYAGHRVLVLPGQGLGPGHPQRHANPPRPRRPRRVPLVAAGRVRKRRSPRHRRRRQRCAPVVAGPSVCRRRRRGWRVAGQVRDVLPPQRHGGGGGGGGGRGSREERQCRHLGCTGLAGGQRPCAQTGGHTHTGGGKPGRLADGPRVALVRRRVASVWPPPRHHQLRLHVAPVGCGDAARAAAAGGEAWPQPGAGSSPRPWQSAGASC